MLQSIALLLERDGMTGIMEFYSDIFQAVVHKTGVASLAGSDMLKATFLREWENCNTSELNKIWILRFLKRFTVRDAKKLETECLYNFVGSELSNRNYDGTSRTNNHFSHWIVSRAKEYVSYLLGSFDVEAVREQFSSFLSLPSRASTRNCCEDTSHRILQVFGNNPDGRAYFSECCRAAGIDLSDDDLSDIFRIDSSTIRLGAVPKSISSYRIVTAETPLHLHFQKIIFDELWRCIEDMHLDGNITIKDQSKMHSLVMQSVLGGENFATLDLHAASDLLRFSLIRELFPSDIAQLIEETRPEFYFHPFFKGNADSPLQCILYMAAPMGAGYTTLLQSIVFWAIDCAACDYADAFIEPSDRKLMKTVRYKLKLAGRWQYINPFRCFTVGDDQQVFSIYAETCCDALESLGFIVNAEKSFSDPESYFRESCGCDALSGERIDSFYFPRHAISLGIKGSTEVTLKEGNFLEFSVTQDSWVRSRTNSGELEELNTPITLVRMQKMLKLFGFSNTSDQLVKWLMRAVPHMTTSESGMLTDDLWADTDYTVQYQSLPMGQICRVILGYQMNGYRKITSETSYLNTWNSTEIAHLRPKHWSVTSKIRRIDRVRCCSSTSCWYTKAKYRFIAAAQKTYSGQNVYYSSSLYHELGEENAMNIKALSREDVFDVLCTKLLEYYDYKYFLQSGPTYSDELSRLLRVTDRQCNHTTTEVVTKLRF
jgi:hypothetical protein